VYGRGLPQDQLDRNSFGDFYSIKNLDNFESEGAPSQEPSLAHHQYYMDSSVSTGENVNTLLNEMQAALVFKRGKFYLRPNNNLLLLSDRTSTTIAELDQQFEIATHTVRDRDIVGGLTVNLTPPDRAIRKITAETVEHKYFLGTTIEDGVTVYWSNPESRNYYSDSENPVATRDYSISLQSDMDSTIFNTLYTNEALHNVVEFVGSNSLLNADVYDKILFDSKTMPALTGRLYQITDLRINPDLTVSVNAVELAEDQQLYEIAEKENLLYTEQYAFESLDKYIYDVPASIAGDIDQFDLQEPDTIRVLRERIVIDDSGGGESPTPTLTITTLGRSPVCPLSNLNLAVRVTYTSATAIALGATVTVRVFNSFGQPISYTVDAVSGAGVCGYKTADRTSSTVYTAVVLIPQSQTYTINVDVSGVVNSVATSAFTAPSAGDYSAISTWHLTTLRQDSSPFPAGFLVGYLTWHTFRATYSGQTETTVQTADISSGTDVAAKLDTPILFEFTALSDSCSTFQPLVEILTITNTVLRATNGITQSTAGNVKLARSYGYLTNSVYDLTVYERAMLQKLGRTDLIYD
jgi:hypothetical protein